MGCSDTHRSKERSRKPRARARKQGQEPDRMLAAATAQSISHSLTQIKARPGQEARNRARTGQETRARSTKQIPQTSYLGQRTRSSSLAPQRMLKYRDDLSVDTTCCSFRYSASRSIPKPACRCKDDALQGQSLCGTMICYTPTKDGLKFNTTVHPFTDYWYCTTSLRA